MLSIHSDEFYMKEALKQAYLALEHKEIPVGAVIVCQNQIIARAYNQTEMLNDVTAHAEMIAITSASNHLGSRYLNECDMYVTLEPCVMCAGALYWSQLRRIVYGATDNRKGYSLIPQNLLHPKTIIERGVMADECAQLVKDFFKDLRAR